MVLALGLTLFGGGVWLAMRHQLYTEIEEGLRSRTTALDEFLRVELADPASNLHDEIGEFARALPSEYAIAVLAPDGQRVYTTPPAERLFRQLTQEDSKTDRWFLTLADGKCYRILEHRTATARPFRVLVADTTDRDDAILRQLGILLIAAIPGVVVLAAAGGYLLSVRALSPVDAMTRAARTIGIENLSERLEVPATDDEIQRLAETWNAMLARLETAVTRISQFTSDASHELRTPIALIRTTAEIALRRPRSAEQYGESLAQIEAESERMTQLVEDLLFLARSDARAVSANMAPVDLHAVIDDICAEMAPRAAEKNVGLLSNVSGGALIVTGRERALRRMLLALLDNALKYTPEGGAIVLSAGEENGEIRVSVCDNGIGIPETALPHIFERFYRADASRSRDSGGHGLGLSIAQTIARQHNGVIVAESSVHAGSEFHVVLPAVSAW